MSIGKYERIRFHLIFSKINESSMSLFNNSFQLNYAVYLNVLKTYKLIKKL